MIRIRLTQVTNAIYATTISERAGEHTWGSPVAWAP